MKKILILLLFTGLSLAAYSQVIKGTVLDRKTKAIIDFASVYFNGTFSGTYTDKNGNFELDISKNTAMPLTISAIGYYSFTMSDYNTGKPLTVYLSPKTYEMPEVVINAKSLASERKSNLLVFRHEFLGKTDNADMCEILNENDITFNYGKDKDTLRAYASKPIFIVNNALGYKITYYLDKFEYYRRSHSFMFSGNLVFTVDLSSDESIKQHYVRRRNNAYAGSRMHFFRELWIDNIKSTGFIIKNSSDEILGYKDIVLEGDSRNKYLSYPEKLIISYYSKLPSSYIVFLKKKVVFYGSGYFDPSGISWIGKMAQQRIGDWLPIEYSPPD